MGTLTWIFVLLGIALTFPLVVNAIAGFMNTDLSEEDLTNQPSGNFFSNFWDSITTFFSTLWSFPDAVKFPIITLYVVLFIYIGIKLLPFT